MTRDITCHPSAVHTLRIALGLTRRCEQVTIFLLDDAARSLPQAESRRALDRLVTAGATVLAEGDVCRPGEPNGVQPSSTEQLAALMTTPGVQAHWC
jgi:hypothetical protein